MCIRPVYINSLWLCYGKFTQCRANVHAGCFKMLHLSQRKVVSRTGCIRYKWTYMFTKWPNLKQLFNSFIALQSSDQGSLKLRPFQSNVNRQAVTLPWFRWTRRTWTWRPGETEPPRPPWVWSAAAPHPHLPNTWEIKYRKTFLHPTPTKYMKNKNAFQ